MKPLTTRSTRPLTLLVLTLLGERTLIFDCKAEQQIFFRSKTMFLRNLLNPETDVLQVHLRLPRVMDDPRLPAKLAMLFSLRTMP